MVKKMLTKGEHLTEDMCYNAWLNILRNPLSCAKKLDILESLIKEHFNPQPYKFEELKKGMWVWDEKEKKCNKIIKIKGRNIDFYYITKDTHRYKMEFEENRFYPVTKALEY